MDSQQELFDARYDHLSQEGHTGWSDDETYAFAIEMYHKMLGAVGVLGGSLLELGCGRGNIALDFAKHGWQATGIDFSESAIRWANDYAIRQNLEAEFVAGDLANPWPFEDEAFDVVMDANCLHFFHGDARTHFLAEAKRCLKPTGTFVLSTIVNQPKEEHWELLGYDPNLKASFMEGVVMNNYLDAPELIAEVAAAGFRILSSVVTENEHELMWLTCRKKESSL